MKKQQNTACVLFIRACPRDAARQLCCSCEFSPHSAPPRMFTLTDAFHLASTPVFPQWASPAPARPSAFHPRRQVKQRTGGSSKPTGRGCSHLATAEPRVCPVSKPQSQRISSRFGALGTSDFQSRSINMGKWGTEKTNARP